MPFLKFPHFYFLNHFDRISIEGTGKNRIANYSDGVKVSLADKTITQWGRIIRKGNTYFIPALWREDRGVIAYSTEAGEKLFDTPFNWGGSKRVSIMQITKNGLKEVAEKKLSGDKLTLRMDAQTPYYIVPVESEIVK